LFEIILGAFNCDKATPVFAPRKVCHDSMMSDEINVHLPAVFVASLQILSTRVLLNGNTHAVESLFYESLFNASYNSDFPQDFYTTDSGSASKKHITSS
jgi:hypothetical protein